MLTTSQQGPNSYQWLHVFRVTRSFLVIDLKRVALPLWVHSGHECMCNTQRHFVLSLFFLSWENSLLWEFGVEGCFSKSAKIFSWRLGVLLVSLFAQIPVVLCRIIFSKTCCLNWSYSPAWIHIALILQSLRNIRNESTTVFFQSVSFFLKLGNVFYQYSIV